METSRYPAAGILHILVFAGFILLATRAFSLILGVSDSFLATRSIGHIYDIVKDYAATIVFLCMVIAAIRRCFCEAFAALYAGLRKTTADRASPCTGKRS